MAIYLMNTWLKLWGVEWCSGVSRDTRRAVSWLPTPSSSCQKFVLANFVKRQDQVCSWFMVSYDYKSSETVPLWSLSVLTHAMNLSWFASPLWEGTPARPHTTTTTTVLSLQHHRRCFFVIHYHKLFLRALPTFSTPGGHTAGRGG